jgi:hypothetical protein
MDCLSTGDCASLIRFEGDRSPHPPKSNVNDQEKSGCRSAIGASETLFGMYGARRSRAVTRAKRGEIWMADLGVAAKVRPVLVLSVAYEVKTGQSSAMSCVQPACAILSTKCVTKLVVCRTEHSTRKVWVHTRDQTRKASGTRQLRDVTWTSRPIGR